jgi:tryptophan synthase alpha chain
MPYISMGDPSYDLSIQWASAVAGSADLIELGIPFSDPIADGPVIQKSYKRSLDNQEFSMDKIFDATQIIFETSNKPLIYISYLNPIVQYGLESFFNNASKIGIRGIVIPDIPFDSKDYKNVFEISRKNGVSIINLITPATSELRMKALKKFSTGFVYYVTSFGVTGTRVEFEKDLEIKIKNVKDILNIPVLAGFGISEPEQARSISRYADGIIIGSRIQKIIEENSADPSTCEFHLKKYTDDIKQAISKLD